MKPKTPLPWDPSEGVHDLIRMLPSDYNYAVYAANAHLKLVEDRRKLVEFVKRLHTGVYGVAVDATSLLKEIGEFETEEVPPGSIFQFYGDTPPEGFGWWKDAPKENEFGVPFRKNIFIIKL